MSEPNKECCEECFDDGASQLSYGACRNSRCNCHTPKDTEATCPKCGAKEVEALTPRTVYACGSSDYDQRPDTFIQVCSQPTPTIDSVVEDEVYEGVESAYYRYTDDALRMKEISAEVCCRITTLLAQQQSHHEATMREVVDRLTRHMADDAPLIQDIKAVASRRGIPLVDKEV